MKRQVLLIFLIVFLLSGCTLIYPYENPKYGSMAIDAFFSDKTLGVKRKEIFDIDEIVSSECNFLERKSNKYVFSCKVTYKEKGETVIPLSKNSVMNVSVVFIKKLGKTYDYRVYSPDYKEKDRVWEQDDSLNY